MQSNYAATFPDIFFLDVFIHVRMQTDSVLLCKIMQQILISSLIKASCFIQVYFSSDLGILNVSFVLPSLLGESEWKSVMWPALRGRAKKYCIPTGAVNFSSHQLPSLGSEGRQMEEM